jgi:hypothetical protein
MGALCTVTGSQRWTGAEQLSSPPSDDPPKREAILRAAFARYVSCCLSACLPAHANLLPMLRPRAPDRSTATVPGGEVAIN